MKRQHPIAFLRYTTKNFWLLLIPLVRGLLALGFDFQKWLNGAYLDVLVLLLILGAAFFRWWNIKFEIGESAFVLDSGFFIKETCRIEYDSIASVASQRPFLLRPIKAAVIYIDTDTQSVMNKPDEADFKLVIRSGDYINLYNKIPDNGKFAKRIYKAPGAKLLFFSLVFSSTLSGLIYFGTLFIQGGKLIDNELEERFVNAFSGVTEIAGRVIKGITPFIAGVIIILAAGWLYSFISNYLRHINFRILRSGKNIMIENGFFSRWKYYINTGKINYADLRQNLLMKIFRVMSVHVNCSGYGKNKNEIPVFVPVTDEKSVRGVMQMLLPEFHLDDISISPRWNYIMRFIGIPTFLIFAVMILAAVLIFAVPAWYSVIFFVAVMGEIMSVHLLFVKLAAFYTNGIGYDENTLALRYCRSFQFHYIIVPREAVISVRLRQTVFQQVNESCDFIVYTRGETVKSHRVTGINLRDAEKFASRLGYDINI